MKSEHARKFESIDDIRKGFQDTGYVCSRQIATTLYLARHLEKPILVEGPAGVGKTELAKAAASYLDIPLIRLQCYEGLDESKALYEWKYGKQLLYTQILKDKLSKSMAESQTLAESMNKLHASEDIFFSTHFLEPRPLFKALKEEKGCVLLVDEVDKSDHEFEAFLLEVLSEYQVSIPEIGTIQADLVPFVVLTSNNTREMGDALKRRCLHLYISYPDAELERKILDTKVPDLSLELQRELVSFVQQLRSMELKKLPSISETIDWAKTLLLLNADHLSIGMVKDTLNTVLKFEEDVAVIADHLGTITRKALEEGRLAHNRK
jgi:MoxR-like ATPase